MKPSAIFAKSHRGTGTTYPVEQVTMDDVNAAPKLKSILSWTVLDSGMEGFIRRAME